MSRKFAVFLALALAPLTLAAQSFDCKLSQTPREKIVCSDTRLSALDAEIAANYKSLRAQLSPESAALVMADQAEWLRWIDLVCPAHGKGVAANQTQCLQQQYFTRANDLAQDKITHLGATVIFVRSHFLFTPGSASPNGPPNDPGFGFGSLRWPQIDKPNAAQAAFNAAVKTRAASLAVHFAREKSDTGKDATFDTAVDTSGIIDAYFTIEAANDRLIAVNLLDGTYGWGAAHPNTAGSSFLWWLNRKRPLTAADVFLPSSNWQQKLVPLAIASLESDPNTRDMLWKGDQIQKPVQQAVADPASWTLTRDGLTITFGQYAVAPYVAGMPQAHIPWSKLTPTLAPTLNPATLPAPVPKSRS